jgi:hypothetical protein
MGVLAGKRMTVLTRILIGVVAILGVCTVAFADQRDSARGQSEAVVQALASGDRFRVSEAIVALQRTPTLVHVESVRNAVVAALQREATLEMERQADAEQGQAQVGGGDTIVIMELVKIVSTLEGDDTLEVLLPHIASSAKAGRRVAEFGERAVPPLLRQYSEGKGTRNPSSVRMGSLLTLAMIRSRAPVSPDHEKRLAETARQALATADEAIIVGGVFLSVACGDPELVQVVRQIAAGDFGTRQIDERFGAWVQNSARRALATGGRPW